MNIRILKDKSSAYYFIDKSLSIKIEFFYFHIGEIITVSLSSKILFVFYKICVPIGVNSVAKSFLYK